LDRVFRRLGVDPCRFHLIAPYESGPEKWTHLTWIDQYSGKTYRISTSQQSSSRKTAEVKTFGDIIAEYAFHAESKCADSRGNVCDKQTRGLLQRRHIQIARIRFIGKESNLLEEVEAGLIHSAQEAYTEYIDPKRDEWEQKIRPALYKVSLKVLGEESGLSRRMLIKARMGQARPHRQNQAVLTDALRRMGVKI
jgi:hypothetical protein